MVFGDSAARTGAPDGDRLALLRRLQQQQPLFGTDPRSLEDLFDLSAAAAARVGTQFGEVAAYCMFIGYSRSGHSLIGSLLDAHDEMVIAHELDALAFVAAGFDWRQLFWLITVNARIFTELGRVWGEFRYEVPERPHGRSARLRVIGDKKGGASTDRIGRDFTLLRRLSDGIPVPVRFVHVIRNPYDNIASMALRSGQPLAGLIDAYFFEHSTNCRIANAVPADRVFHLHHEEFIAAPREQLAAVCRFLGVAATADYLADCAATVYGQPRRSREHVEWAPALVAEVERRCALSPLLRRYGFAS